MDSNSSHWNIDWLGKLFFKISALFVVYCRLVYFMRQPVIRFDRIFHDCHSVL